MRDSFLFFVVLNSTKQKLPAAQGIAFYLVNFCCLILIANEESLNKAKQ